MTLVGWGYLPKSTYTVTWDSATLPCASSQVETSSAGVLECSFTVPAAAGGPHAIAVSDGAAVPDTTFASFDVTSTLALSSQTGTVGQTLQLVGTGYPSSSRIVASWDASAAVCATFSAPDGTFSCSFTIPSAGAGTHTISASVVGAAATSTTPASFTVLPALTLSSSSGVVGSSVTALGSGFPANQAASIVWSDGSTACTARAAANGNLACAFTVPESSEGPHSVAARLGSDPSVASVGATFSVGPVVSVSALSGSVGASVNVVGTGFAADSAYSLLWDWATIPCDGASVQTTSDGSFACSLSIPATVAGAHTVSAEAAGTTATAAHSVVVHPEVSLSEPTATVGSYVVVTGTGLWENARLSVSWDSTVRPLCQGVTADGGFSCLISVPAATAGTHTVTVRDLSSDGGAIPSVTTELTVLPSLVLGPDSGASGVLFNVSGAGFAAIAPVQFTWDGGTLACQSGVPSTDALGGFNCLATIPAAPNGVHVITATDLSPAANSAQSNFWVISALPAPSAAGPRPSATCNSGCSISLSTSSGPVGTSVTVSGSSFAASASVSVTWSPNAVSLCTATTSSGGSFSCSFVIPPAVQGSHTVTAADNAIPSNFNTAAFTVTSDVELSSNSGSVGSSVTATGSGFAASSAMTVTWSPGSITVCTTTTNGSGSFTCAFQVPSDVQGVHTVTGTDASSNSAAASYTVNPKIALSASSGAVGITLTVSGTGFAGSSATTVAFDASSMSCTQGSITTHANGTFVCTFTVPSAVIGSHTISATDHASNTASALFTVVSTIALSPTSGPVGTLETVSGTGFAGASGITVSWTPAATECTATSTATGDFSCSFDIPIATAGSHTVVATDSSTNTATNVFVVTSDLIFSPNTSGIVGSTQTVDGYGYAATSTITVTWSPSGAGTLCTATSDSLGSFSCSLTIPTANQGAHTVTAKDASANTGTTTFTVLPSVSVSPTSGIVGSSATVEGNGYTSGASVTVSWSAASTLTCTVGSVVSATGTWSCTFTVPHTAQGTYTITATESSGSPSSAVTSFTVNPALSISPTTAIVGDHWTWFATGFASGASISIVVTWAPGTYSCSGSVASNGDFTCVFSFPIPPTPAGTYLSTATDSASNTATTNITIVPSLGLSASSGTVGTTGIIAAGYGFAAGSSVHVTWSPGGSALCSATTDSAGSFTCTYTVPHGVAGAHTITATDSASPTPNTATATFTVLPSIALGTTSGPVGTSVTVTGEGFAGSASISVGWSPSGSLCSATSSSVGDFTCSFTVPLAHQGNHAVTASDGTNSASALFSVNPTLTISPTSGPVGTVVLVSGTGYGASVSVDVSVTWVGITYICGPTTDAFGSFPTSACDSFFTVPATPAGAYTFTGVDTSSNHSSASAVFTVTSKVTLSPTSGPVGASVTVTGTGFAASSTVSMSWDGSQALTCTGGSSCGSPPQATFSTDTHGGFTATFVVPPAAQGAHTVSAVDGSSNSASATFSVSPSLEITYPGGATGVVGSLVSILGNGFASGAHISVLYAASSPVAVCAGSTNLTGAFVCSFTVPDSIAGSHTVTATDASSNTASSTFTVLSNLVVNPASGIVGSSTTATGTGFAGSSSVSLTWDGSTSLSCTSGSLTTSANGGFNCTFTVPADVAGSHPVAATDGSSNSASTSFTVVPHVVLVPTHGTVGSTFTADLTGFANSYYVSPNYNTWDGSSIPIGSIVGTGSGSWTLTFVVPASAHGSHTFLANDGFGDSASATFNVDASLSLSPSFGIVGSSATATGAGFAASSAVSVTWAPGAVSLCTSSTSTLGAFSCSFAVPHAVSGGHTVTATDASTNSATATYTVDPNIVLSPTSGIVGSSVLVTGTGFPGSTSYSVTFASAVVACAPSGSTNTVGDFACSFAVPSAVAGPNVVQGIAGAQVGVATYTVDPSISLSVTSGPVGTSVTVTGTGFAGGSPTSVTWSPSGALCSATTAATGGFSCAFLVPAAVQGPHTVSATDSASPTPNTATATFTVVPKLVLSPSTGLVASTPSAEGSGFAATSAVTLTWTPVQSLNCVSGSLTTDSTGSFDCVFAVPPAVTGGHVVTATDASSNSATATFTVVPGLVLTPSSGIVGSTSTATGTGFGGAASVSVTWSPLSLALCAATANATGSFACAFTVPSAVHGGHVVTATDSLTDSATATFTVGAELVLTPASGLVGSSTTATGTGFAGGSAVTLTWSGPTTSLSCTSGSLTTSGTGSFTCAFTVPSAPIGGHTVTAVDASSNSASAVFTVGPYITVSPTSGSAEGYGITGTTVTVSGAGFTAGDTVTVTWAPGTLCSGLANGVGSFSCSSVIPATPAAKYTLTGTDAHSNSATTSLTVVPTVLGAPDGLMVGGNIWVNGTGFYASESVNVVWTPVGSSGYSICPSTTTMVNGSFTCGTFTIPREAAGPVQIVVTDSGLQASFNYTVTTNLTVTVAVTAPASQPPTDVGVTLTFTATAMLGFTPYASYEWTFGDGSTATTTADTVSHAYSSASGAGGFTASVTVTDAVGSQVTGTTNVPVNPDPTVTTPAASRTSADVGQTVTFTTTESGGTAGGIVYTWNGLPSGCTGITTASVTCSAVPAATTLSISVTVTDGPYSGIGGSYTSGTLLFTVYPDPTVSIAPSVSSADIGQGVTISGAVAGGSGLNTYSWSGLPAGCPASPTTGSVTCTVTSAGPYSVTLTVTDSNGKSTTSAPLSFTVFADPALPTPSASRGSADLGQSVTFSDVPTSAGSGGLLWTWSGLPVGCGGSTSSLTCNPSASGTYSVSVKITDSNGFAVTSGSLSFTVYADPTTTIVPTVASADIGQSVTFTSTTNGGSGGISIAWSGLPTGCPAAPATASVACASVSASGTFLVSETVTDSNGVGATSNVVTFNVYPDPTVTVSASPVSADVGQTVIFTATAASGSGTYAFAWTGLPAGCPAAPTSPDVSCTVTTAAGSTVSATVTDSNGKAVTSTALGFTVFSDPSVSASSTRSTADVGQTVSFTASPTSGSGGFSYSWSGLPSGCSGSTAIVSCVAPNSVTTSATFAITVKVTDSNGESVSSSSIALTVYADPTLFDASNRSSGDVGQSVTLSAASTLGSGSNTYSWTGLPATGCLGVATATVTCVLPSTLIGTYSITATVSDSDGFTATSIALDLSVFADPTVTTPTSSVASADVGQGVAFELDLRARLGRRRLDVGGPARRLQRRDDRVRQLPDPRHRGIVHRQGDGDRLERILGDEHRARVHRLRRPRRHDAHRFGLIGGRRSVGRVHLDGHPRLGRRGLELVGVAHRLPGEHDRDGLLPDDQRLGHLLDYRRGDRFERWPVDHDGARLHGLLGPRRLEPHC